MAAQLNRVQAEDYIWKVDDELCQQRRRLLALDTPLSVLLPQHLLGLPPSVKADYIADRLLFTLAVGAMHYYTSADLQPFGICSKCEKRLSLRRFIIG